MAAVCVVHWKLCPAPVAVGTGVPSFPLFQRGTRECRAGPGRRRAGAELILGSS